MKLKHIMVNGEDPAELDLTYDIYDGDKKVGWVNKVDHSFFPYVPGRFEYLAEYRTLAKAKKAIAEYLDTGKIPEPEERRRVRTKCVMAKYLVYVDGTYAGTIQHYNNLYTTLVVSKDLRGDNCTLLSGKYKYSLGAAKKVIVEHFNKQKETKR